MEGGVVRQFLAGNEVFSFNLCRKRQMLGETSIDHWWMRTNSLYAQRRRNSSLPHNPSEILRLYWAEVQRLHATGHREAQERFLLAALVPLVRSQGSRNIFADSIPARGHPEDRREQTQTLELALQSDREHSISRGEFHRRSWEVLGRPVFPEEFCDAYIRFAHDLMDEACSALAGGEVTQALEAVKKHWAPAMQKVGRRSGKFLEKLVLDVLSYEARAAIHHCYSVVWSVLIPLLAGEEHWNEAAVAFHRFWHMDWMDSQSGASLFHGHIFGLHPAAGTFMQTMAGPSLLGDWLNNLESVELFGRVLNGLLTAIFAYRQRRELVAENRPHRRVETHEDLEEVENQEEEEDDDDDDDERRRG
jgi:hypothetical protein